MGPLKKYSVAAAVAAVFLACAFNIEWFRAAAARAGRHSPDALKFAALAAAAATYFSFGKTRTGTAKNRRCQSLFFPSWLKEAAAISAAVILFLMPLFQAWTSDRDPALFGGNPIMGAYLQTKDAGSYYIGAQSLARTGKLNDWNLRRPLNASWQSLAHTLAGWDMKWFLIMQAAPLGLACWSLARIVGREFGPAAGTAAFMLMLMWGRCFVYTAMSENLGMILGASALALLWTGVRAKSLWVYFFGLAVLTTALNARAGTFFALPALALWGGWALSGTSRFSLKPAAAGAAAVALGFLIHTAPPLIYNGKPAVGHDNFACVIYGISEGGAGWREAYDKYSSPKVSRGEFNKLVLGKAFGNIKRRPALAAKGLAKYAAVELRDVAGALSLFFVEKPFVQVRTSPPLILVLLATTGLLGAGWLRFALSNAGDKCAHLVFVGTAGILASLPLLADGGWRAITATAPFIAVNVGFAFAGLQKVIPSRKSEGCENNFAALPAAISAAFLLACVAGPGIAHQAEKMKHGGAPRFALEDCRREEVEIVVDAEKAQFLEILAPDSAERTFKPKVRSEDLIYTTLVFEVQPKHLKDREVIENYSGPKTIIAALDHGDASWRDIYCADSAGEALPLACSPIFAPSGNLYYIFAPPGAMENHPGWMYFCGDFKEGDATAFFTGMRAVFVATSYGRAEKK